MTRLHISLLGSYRILLDGKPIHGFDSDKTRLLLAYLAVEAHTSHRREQLAGLFWPEQNDASANHSLSQALYNLRHLLGEHGRTGPLGEADEVQAGAKFLFIDAYTVQFNPHSDHILDTRLFSELLTGCQRHSHRYLEACPDCMARLVEAEALYQGDFLTDLSLEDSVLFEEWSMAQRERLRRQMIEILGYLAQCHTGRGELQAALQAARRQVQLDPLWEAGQRQLIHLLALNGQRSAALDQYEACRRMLAEELGIAPESDTVALAEQFRQEVFPAGIAGRLPVPAGPFVGRKDEQLELQGYLRDPGCRLLNVLGSGGCGKTRLVLEVAQRLTPDFPDGIYFISLSAYQPGSPLWVLLAEALHFPTREHQDPEQQLLDYLGSKQILLIFDSFETALEQAAWLAGLLQHVPRLTILVTSRARLEISAEQVFPLGGMQVPVSDEAETVDQFEAVQLFLAFARQRQPTFALDERSRSGVARICRAVQGLPLGLLLASAWVELYTPQEIAEQIERSLDFLEVSWSDMPSRQRSLRATFDYSWEQLKPAEQDALTALAVFHGNFSLAAVREVAQAPARTLQSLVDKSMVSRTPDGRYQLHDLLRQFAAQRLEHDPERLREMHTRHSRYFLEKLGQWEVDLKGARQREALEAIDWEAEDLRAAWRWAVLTRNWQGIATGLEGMSWFVDLRFRFVEGERACRTALEQLSPLSHSSLISALTAWQAHFLCRLGQAESAGRLLQAEQSRLKELQDEGGEVRLEQARVLYELGELSMSIDRETAKSYYQQSLALFDALGDERGQALVLISLGEALHHTGPLDQAQHYLERGEAICRRLCDPRLLARALLWSGWNNIRQGDLPSGAAQVRESIDINRSIGDRYAEAFWGAELGRVNAWSGRLKDAVELLSQSIGIYRELNLKQEATFILLVKGLVELNLLNLGQALHDFQACMSASYEQKYQRGIGVGLFGMGCVRYVEGDFQKAEELLLQAIPILQVAQADEAGWCLGLLVSTMRQLGQPLRGWQYAYQALEIALKAHVYLTAAATIRGIATLLVDEGQVERAIELHELTRRYPIFDASAYYQAVSGHFIEQVAASLPEETVKAARERSRERDLFTTAAELEEEMRSRMVTLLEQS